jgi:hypothetical protein
MVKDFFLLLLFVAAHDYDGVVSYEINVRHNKNAMIAINIITIVGRRCCQLVLPILMFILVDECMIQSDRQDDDYKTTTIMEEH